MTTAPVLQRYSFVSILLHWLMLALLIGVYLTAELQEGGGPDTVFGVWHYTFGLTVFAMVWLRIVARIVWPAPPAAEGGWRGTLSKVVHGALYLLMIGMPVVGWLILSAEGKKVAVFGGMLPSLISADHGLAERLEELHEIGGSIGYWLIGLHAAAALFHHYFLRDETMLRMLPRRA